MTSSIVIENNGCLNNNYKKLACRLCRDACPVSCIGEKGIVSGEACRECGLCLGVCPASAVKGNGFSPEPLEKALLQGHEPVRLSCRRQDVDSPWPCLGFLDARLLLALAYSGDKKRQVLVDNRGCSCCPNSNVAERLDEAIAGANGMLAAAGRSEIICGQGVENHPKTLKPISRRAFFSELFGATMETVREVIVPSVDGGKFIPRHQWFARYVIADEINPKLVPDGLYYALVYGNACQACGLCAKVCPSKALRIVDLGDKMEFHLEPGKCTGCGVCVIHCPQEALAVVSGNNPKEYVAATPMLPRCACCGEVFQPVGRRQECLECSLKGNRSQVW